MCAPAKQKGTMRNRRNPRMRGHTEGILWPGAAVGAGLDRGHERAVGGAEFDAEHRQRLLAVLEQDLAEIDVSKLLHMKTVTPMARDTGTFVLTLVQTLEFNFLNDRTQ